jgi:hypothetical protein
MNPVEKVFAEEALPDLTFKVLLGGDDHPHVDLDRFITANGIELPLLKGPQKLGLNGKGHISNFIQEKRPGMGLSE